MKLRLAKFFILQAFAFALDAALKYDGECECLERKDVCYCCKEHGMLVEKWCLYKGNNSKLNAAAAFEQCKLSLNATLFLNADEVLKKVGNLKEKIQSLMANWHIEANRTEFHVFLDLERNNIELENDNLFKTLDHSRATSFKTGRDCPSLLASCDDEEDDCESMDSWKLYFYQSNCSTPLDLLCVGKSEIARRPQHLHAEHEAPIGAKHESSNLEENVGLY